MSKKIVLVSLGCPKNLVDSENMLGLLEKSGWEPVPTVEEADAIIVNTCSFIGDARTESVDAILRAAKSKSDSESKSGTNKLLIVSGCLSQMYGDEIFKEIPEVDAVVGTGSVGRIAEILSEAEEGKKRAYLDLPCRSQFPGNNRLLSTPKGQAFLKIAEGCDNKCTYCVIPSLRGKYISRDIESILEEAHELTDKDVSEITLVAQDTTRYGTDLYGKTMLSELVSKLSDIPKLKWIRLLYCYPEMIDEDLINEYATNEKLVKYIDIPIQHASDRILKLMGRRGKSSDNFELVNRLRSSVPDIIIRTSLIVGFPGETQEDFANLYEFVQKCRFDRLGVFRYSKEDITPAAKMKEQISKSVKNTRYKEIMELQRDISLQNNRAKLGKTYETIVEGVADDGIFYYGRTYAEAPEIDGKIYFTAQKQLAAGEFVNVKVLDVQEYDLTGEVTV